MIESQQETCAAVLNSAASAPVGTQVISQGPATKRILRFLRVFVREVRPVNFFLPFLKRKHMKLMNCS